MKKVLSALLFLFSLSFPIGSSTSTIDVISKNRIGNIVNKINVKHDVITKLNLKDSIAYHSLDSIPLCSPVNIDLLKISSDYGIRKHPIFRINKFHHGIDIIAPFNSPIKSTADGVVELVEMSKRGYGNQIIIRHANGYKTRYAHLNKISVNVGDSIKKNQEIGLLGRSGLTTGNHLHYEVFKDEKQIDPLFFITERSIANYIDTLITLEYT